MKKQNLRISLVCCYFFVTFLAPWFHLHPGVNHKHASGDSYHSHAKPFHAHSSEESKSETRESSFPSHVIEATPPVTKGVLVYPNWEWSKQLLLGQAYFESDHNLLENTSSSNPFENIIPPLRQDWYIQFTTNLSPPLI